MDDKKSLSEIEKLRSALQTANLPANLHDKAAEQIERIEVIYHNLISQQSILIGSATYHGTLKAMMSLI